MHLGGATARELAACRGAALQLERHLEVAERVAILVLYGDGWRERVTERVPLQWDSPRTSSTCTRRRPRR